MYDKEAISSLLITIEEARVYACAVSDSLLEEGGEEGVEVRASMVVPVLDALATAQHKAEELWNLSLDSLIAAGKRAA